MNRSRNPRLEPEWFTLWKGPCITLSWIILLLGSALPGLLSEPCRAETAQPAAPDDPIQSVYIVLDLEPAFVKPSTAADTVTENRERAYRAREQHDALRPRIESLGAVVTGEMVRLVNVIRVQVPSSRIGALQAIPGVASIEPVPTYHPQMDRTVPFLKGPSIWNGAGLGPPGFTGKGIRIGIVDTGIDYTHADFGGTGTVEAFKAIDPSRILPGTFPTTKVIGGFDFVGDDYDADDPARRIPRPDPNPIDLEGHGTHVAGIAAGLGVMTNGVAYTGAYDTSIDFASFGIGPGMAPEALLYSLKVFGGGNNSTQSLLEAVEWASDPDGDLDPRDRLDVLNLSISEPYGIVAPWMVDQISMDRISLLGCVVTISAGNIGDSFHIVGSPSQAGRAISVANSIPAGRFAKGVQIKSPASLAGVKMSSEASFSRPLSEAGVIEGEVIATDPIDACGPLANASAIQGKIALIRRGSCNFAEKCRMAEEAGAIAVILMNNAPGDPFTAGGTGDIRIPMVMISQDAGRAMTAVLEAGEKVTARLDPSIIVPLPELTDRISSSSSRGPGSPDAHLKPDLAAPGQDILSAKYGTGHHGMVATGTSMSAPLVAGVAALLRQCHPKWTVEEIKAALMNSAVPMRDGAGNRYGESRVGAGRVQPDAAVTSTLLAYADDGSGQVSISFGALFVTNRYRDSRTIRLVNRGTNAVDLDVSIIPTLPRAGFSLAPRTRSLRIPPQGTAPAEVDLLIDPSKVDVSLDPTADPAPGGKARHFPNEASGQIEFSHAGGRIHVPYYAQVRVGADWQSDRSLIRPAVSTYTEERIDLPLRFRGFSVQTNPMVSAFELGATSTPLNTTDPAALAMDLLAVGAATDGGLQSDPEEATLYFGIATAGPWTSTARTMIRVNVEIDRDGDGKPDFTIVNGDSGSPDVLETKVTPAGGASLPGLPINVERPDRLNTAAFNNQVLVLPVKASSVGLTHTSTAFRYRVQTFAQPSFFQIDETPWTSFDVIRPIIDTVRHSPARTPLYTGGQEIQVRLDRQAAETAGVVMPGVLLLHHFNPPGRRHEIVRIDDSGYRPVQIIRGTTAVSGQPPRFGFDYTGPAGLPLVVERSLDLVTWEAVQTGIFTERATSFTAPQAGDDSPGFYRVRIP